MMRSQLDCQDPRLPRQTFDLKTRAVVAVRSDRANWVEASGYQIRHSHGLMESFEREYFDMIRAAFLKYSFQVSPSYFCSLIRDLRFESDHFLLFALA